MEKSIPGMVVRKFSLQVMIQTFMNVLLLVLDTFYVKNLYSNSATLKNALLK